MFTLILKGTNGCNFSCRYCSVGPKETVHVADEALLFQILQYSADYCHVMGENHLAVILHGGEPTLISSQVYQNAFQEFISHYPDLDLHISMQTNGFSLDDEMLCFLRNWNVSIGVSLDGGAAIHDMQRLDRTGHPTYDQVTQNILAFQKQGLPVSCLMVLTQNGLRESFDYLRWFEEHQIPLKINPLLNYGEAMNHPELTLQSGDYGRYLIGVYEYILERDLSVRVSPLDKLLQPALP